MEESYKVIQLKENHRLYVDYDTNTESPNEWDNEEQFIVFSHRQFNVEREGFNPESIYKSYKEKDGNYLDFYKFPLFAYIHSGVTLSLEHNGDRFDTSSTGWILIKKKELEIEEAIKIAKSLIDLWNTYLRGEVFRFTIVKVRQYVKVFFPLKTEQEILEDLHKSDSFEEEEDVDSCGGFYSLEDMLEYIDPDLLDEEIKKEFISN